MAFIAFLLLVGLGAAWCFSSEQQRRRRVIATEMTQAIFDSYAYLDDVPLSRQGLENQIEKETPIDSLVEAVHDVFVDHVVEEEHDVLLGIRPPNITAGLALEREYELAAAAVSTTAEMKAFRSAQPLIEQRLERWGELARERLPVMLPQRHRDRHTYVVGKSGSGKTMLLTWMAIQDAASGNGLCFLSPEVETIEDELMPYLPASRLDDIIYFNPADPHLKHSINPFTLGPGEDLELKVEEVYTIISRVLDGDMSPRISQVLRNTIYTLVAMPGATLLDVPELLDPENDHFRKTALAYVKDPATRRFWMTTYPALPKNAYLPILTRLSAFVRSGRVRNVLCREDGHLDFRTLMDEGKIVLCSLSDGLLGEHVSALLGSVVLSNIQLATMSRANTPQHQRRRFYAYVDEFQTFTGSDKVSFEKILGRARKYRLPLILAHQQTGQIPPSLLKEILGNVNTVVCFNVSADDGSRFSREFILENGERVSADELITQEVGYTVTKIGNYAFPMRTQLHGFDPDWELKREIIASSRRPLSVKAAESSPLAETAAPVDVFAEEIDAGNLFGDDNLFGEGNLFDDGRGPTHAR